MIFRVTNTVKIYFPHPEKKSKQSNSLKSQITSDIVHQMGRLLFKQKFIVQKTQGSVFKH